MIMLTMRPVTLLLLLGATLGLSAAQDPCFCVKQVPLTDGKTSPTVLANAGDDSGRLFYGEQNGKVWVWQKNGDGDWEELPEPFVDLSDFILVGGEQGFLSLEFHPDHADNGLLYMYYSYSTTEGDRVTLLTEVSVEEDNPNRVDISSERQLLQIPQPFSNHNGGDIVFADFYEGGDPDKAGYLYIGIGDGGAAGDPFNYSQDPSTWLGKLLRIDPLRRSEGEAYGIPADNPFLGNDTVLPEIYALGLRNPWRISVDRPTGNTFIGDVGQNRVEEIDIMKGGDNSGLNFGWSPFEGTECYKAALCDELEGRADLQWPIYEYTHEDGSKSVTGGFVYRGCQNPGFTGDYFAADYVTGRMYRLSDNGDDTWDGRQVEVCGDCSAQNPAWSSDYFRYIQTFGIDEEGEVYFASNQGQFPGQPGYVYQLIDPDTYQEQC